MGMEMACRATYCGKTGEGLAHLDSDHVRFKGDFAFRIPFASMSSVVASGASLKMETVKGLAELRLGKAEAEKWFIKIRYPKPVIDKLGVKAGQKVWVQGVRDEWFVEQVRERVEDVTFGRRRKGCDLIFLGVDDEKGLSKLESLEGCIVPTGAIWVVWPKGVDRVKEDDVRRHAKAFGLVDVKVVKFSETHSGLKLMIPKARR